MDPNHITLSYPTFGPSGDYGPAATYKFMTSGYKPPAQGRSVGYDVVHNQNGIFKYIYDNGPNFKKWEPFELILEDEWATLLGATATVQYQNLLDLWDHVGQMLLSTPDGLYDVHWAASDLEKTFRRFPYSIGDKIEYSVTVQFEEA